jgi:hypothetical protein
MRPRLLRLEPLEDRCVPSTVLPGALHLLTPPAVVAPASAAVLGAVPGTDLPAVTGRAALATSLVGGLVVQLKVSLPAVSADATLAAPGLAAAHGDITVTPGGPSTNVHLELPAASLKGAPTLPVGSPPISQPATQATAERGTGTSAAPPGALTSATRGVAIPPDAASQPSHAASPVPPVQAAALPVSPRWTAVEGGAADARPDEAPALLGFWNGRPVAADLVFSLGEDADMLVVQTALPLPPSPAGETSPAATARTEDCQPEGAGLLTPGSGQWMEAAVQQALDYLLDLAESTALPRYGWALALAAAAAAVWASSRRPRAEAALPWRQRLAVP